MPRERLAADRDLAHDDEAHDVQPPRACPFLLDSSLHGRARMQPSAGAGSKWVSPAGRAPLVALSFDDGPHPENTPRVLEILQRYDARATFFLIGDRAERQPDVVAAIRAGGHEIGNHYLYYRHGFALAHSDGEVGRHLRDERRFGEIAA